MPVTLSIPIARARRGAVGAAVRLGQPLTKTSNPRGLASYPLRNGGASHLAQQKLLPRASCRHATSASQQGQVAGAEASEVSDERSTKEGENDNYRGTVTSVRRQVTHCSTQTASGTALMRQTHGRCPSSRTGNTDLYFWTDCAIASLFSGGFQPLVN